MNNVKKIENKTPSTLLVIHVHYTDVLKGILMNVDQSCVGLKVLVCTTSRKAARQCSKIAREFEAISIKVIFGNNRGRNFGVWFVEYGKQTLDFDFVAHVHTKKSLDSGEEQTEWATHIQNSIVSKLHQHINFLLDHPKVKIIAPSNKKMPVWAYSALKNASVDGTSFNLPKLSSDQFLAYPVGSMFISRANYLSPLFERVISYDDFPSEPIPRDGTILHLLERSLGNLADLRDYSHIKFFDPEKNAYNDFFYEVVSRYHFSDELFINTIINNHDCASFDIFDTIVSRNGRNSDHAKLILGQKLSAEFQDFTPEEFLGLRNKVERQLRNSKSLGDDVCIIEIYDAILMHRKLSHYTSQDLAWLEFEFDFAQMRPRKKVIELINRLKDRDLEIIFTSDMYYNYSMVAKLLSRLGFGDPVKLFLSSQTGMRKDNATIWSTLKQKYPSLIHIGDNPMSDAQIPGDFGIRTLHVISEQQYAQLFEMQGIPKIVARMIARSQVHFH